MARTPASWHACAVSMAYSANTIGSLYVDATAPAPDRRAAAAMSVGCAGTASVSHCREADISQFWQKRHAELQPAVPKLSTRMPGW